jgi:alpha-galactosidase
MKTFRIVFLFFIIANLTFATPNHDVYVVETENTMMLFSGRIGEKFLFQYYGQKLDDVSLVRSAGIAVMTEAYPAFGINCLEDKAFRATHSDGNMSTDLYLISVERTDLDDNASLTKVSLSDNRYPFFVNLYYKAFYKENVIITWTEIFHKENSQVTLYKYASCYLPVRSFAPWLTHFHGHWADEFGMVEEKLERGQKVIKNRNGIRGTQTDNPSFMLSLDGQPAEDKGDIIAGTLAWTGNYSISLDVDQKYGANMIVGIDEEASQVMLEKKEVFQTPEFILTFSHFGKGGATRNITGWARNYGVIGGQEPRMVLLNSWEGVYFDINEDKMLGMIDDIAALGGELFVMDDGWFGDKYPRNNETTSLGDWVVNRNKLPNGLDPLINRCKARGIKFGIWMEPEMVNVKSELFDKHPDWIVHQPNRETVKGRGGSQMLLDMCKPEVQDFVYHAVHDLLVKYSGISYIKWDANHFMTNIGSSALPAEEQSEFYITYQRGLQKTLERIRKDHPDLVMQVCASGGGRVTYGFLKYFDEFWTSDNTDALSRLYMQWSASHFFPALSMATAVSASPNHQTGRQIPLKFRFDVAMTGRLGIELQPKDLTEEEYEFSKKAIETYKTISPVIQFGDQYRIISPYDGNAIASLMYVNETKDRAVFFVYSLDNHLKYRYPPVKFQGLDAKKKYKLTEINKLGQKSSFPADNRVFSGDFLLNAGIQINMRKAYQSLVIELVEMK